MDENEKKAERAKRFGGTATDWSPLGAVPAANAEKLKMMEPLIEEKCRLNTRAANFVIVGCEEVDGYEAVANGDKVDTTKVI